ncbi:phage transcriptional repressor [Streptococcus pneumoniae]|uniref:XRE family transcriptional regulator n=1 Tax=Streptococcus pneumoniae TaxID=1313 RepID=UPI00027322B6|nr:S24 family peptidase [Streptococcus pneumoniae]EJG45553.1 helix-turn-helix family protein [Streptococcus pneumoniae 2070425]KYQ26511.1 XRE family transcriptional regulator [Streptococcus pneumoniae]MBW5236844.1 helix-turn-helix domain-containing protein [Streptococcus pneumoniae]MBW8170560.1 helix-turn-helix domain-containing protein [Streptococcus pneumoniae]MBX4483932.1 helix-turn-helix domain-containing protein [Streptococcus pneumoniae]
MNILGSSIKEVRKSKKLTQKKLAELTGFKQNTISNHENGNRQLDEKDIRIYAQALEVSPQYLFDLAKPSSIEIIPTTSPIQTIYDELEPPRQGKVLNYAKRQLKEQRNEEETKINEVSEAIRLYSYDYYDHPASAGTGQYLNDVRVERIELPVDVDADFVIPIKGDSMEPDYHDGDLVFIQTSVDLNDGVIGVFNYNGDAYIKQLVIDEDQAYLHSLNPEYKDMPITPDTDFRIIGEVVDLYREK